MRTRPLHSVVHGEVWFGDVGVVCVTVFAMRLKIVLGRSERVPIEVGEGSQSVADVSFDVEPSLFGCFIGCFIHPSKDEDW